MEDVTTRAQQLIAELEKIPVAELAKTARDNLQATKITRTTRGQKDPETGERLPDTVSEPDYVTRQKALEWIGAMIGAAPTAARKPVEPVKAEKSAPEPGSLIGKAGKVKSPASP